MTREEAIEKLELMRQKVDEETYRALILAIKALSQEPCEKCEVGNPCLYCKHEFSQSDTSIEQEPTEKPITVDEMEREYEKSKALFHKIVECDDAISRQAILDGIEELKKSPWATDKRGNGFEYLITEALDVVADLCVKQLPPVTQKSGVWVEIDDEPHEVWECDHCGFVIDGSGCIEPYEYRDIYKYCPNCGAKMEVDK